jgi:hypothetical protein
MPSLKKNFFYFERLKLWEKRVIAVYIVITVTLSLFYIKAPFDKKEAILIGYGIGTQLFLFFALYTSLRNSRSYLIWCSFGILHLIIYFFLGNDQFLKMARGNAASSLKNTIILLFVFQLLRFISIKFQHREFVVPTHGGGKDLFENREVSGVDYLVFVLYMGCFAGLVFLSLN